MRPAISTAFARALGGDARSPSAIVDVALRAQAGAVVLDAGLDGDSYEPLVAELERRGDELPILGLEAPCPATVRPGAREPELAAPDRDEADAALLAALVTVRRAGALRAPFVVVRLGEVRPAAGDWIHARDRYLRGELDAELAQKMLQARDQLAERALDGARRALERLAREAERAGVVVLVRNGRRYVDVPTPRELDRLRQELSGAPLMPMLDVAAAHLTDVMGFAPLALTLAAYGGAPLCYFGDACGPVGALAPGRGVVDLAAVRAALASEARLAFHPWAGLDVDEVIDAMSSI
jgi:sugar phosphate isomerase/epimerase